MRPFFPWSMGMGMNFHNLKNQGNKNGVQKSGP